MGFADAMRVLSNVECGLASTVSYMNDVKSGVPRPYAAGSLFMNLGNGFARNEVAYEMQLNGCSYGNFLNSIVGYGNPVSNTIGTLGLMSVCSPWMFFNSPCCYSPMMGMGMGMYPMGMYGNLGMGGYCFC